MTGDLAGLGGGGGLCLEGAGGGGPGLSLSPCLTAVPSKGRPVPCLLKAQLDVSQTLESGGVTCGLRPHALTFLRLSQSQRNQVNN